MAPRNPSTPSQADTAVDTALLHALLEASGPLTAQALALRLKLAPAAVSRRLRKLHEGGCHIQEHPQHGVRLLSAGLECWADYIEPRHAGTIGRRLFVYRTTTSTQDVARQLAASPDATSDGHVVVADHQSAGRGRLGRRWLNEPGSGLLLTAIVAHRGASVDRLMLASCCAVAAAIEELSGLGISVRWPNDLLIGGDKLAGILLETVGPLALIGIGLNVNGQPHSLPPDADSATRSATSLAAHMEAPDRLRLLDRILHALQTKLHHAADGELIAFWKQRATLLGRRVTVDSAGHRLTGRVIDLDPTAGLLLQTDRGGVTPLPAQTTSLVAE